ncbi:MAG: flagellar hook-length control protein FliK [Microgenomates group bacterium]
MQLGQNAAVPFLVDLPPSQKNMVCDAGDAAGAGSVFADFIAQAEAANVSGVLFDADCAPPRLAGELLGEAPSRSEDTVEADNLAFAWLLLTATPLRPVTEAVMVSSGAPDPMDAAGEDAIVSTEIAELEGKILLQSNSGSAVQSAVYTDEATATDLDKEISQTGQPNSPLAFTAGAQDAVGMWGADARLQQSGQIPNAETTQTAQLDSPRFQGPENAFGVLAARQGVGADQVAGSGLFVHQAPNEVPLNAAPQTSGDMTDLQASQLQLSDASAANDSSSSGARTAETEVPDRSGHRAEVVLAFPKDLALVAGGAAAETFAMTQVMTQAKAMDLNAKQLPGDTLQSAGLSQVPLRKRVSLQQVNWQPNVTATSSAKANLAKATSVETDLNLVKEVSLGFLSSLGFEAPKPGVTAFVTAVEGAKINPATVVAQIIHQLHQKPAGTVEINLHPKDLGKLHFEMVPKGEGMSVTLSAEQPQTMELLRKGADQLLQELRNAGFVGSTINFDQWGQRPQQQSSQATPFGTDPEGEEIASQILAPQNATAASSGRSLDIRL